MYSRILSQNAFNFQLLQDALLDFIFIIRVFERQMRTKIHFYHPNHNFLVCISEENKYCLIGAAIMIIYLMYVVSCIVPLHGKYPFHSTCIIKVVMDTIMIKHNFINVGT